ncbi:PPA1309 family protein [Kribbella flavida]|uniref:PPA1309 family protein n=1 Tax=Kribbella flavida TaxID=182640 RepID=UPI00192AB417|nr:PPA1309 family protein [Kribbella flavida]
MHAIDNLPADALSRAVVEIEKHVSSGGWDQPAQLFALVPTEELLAAEPKLAAELGADDASQPLTPVAQGELPGGTDDSDLAGVLAPDRVAGRSLRLRPRGRARRAAGRGRGRAVECRVRRRAGPDGGQRPAPARGPDGRRGAA